VEDREFFVEEEEEEEAAEEEGANRTFIILVAALGGVLALGICAFVVWAVILGPRMTADRVAQNQAILATNTAVAEAAERTAAAVEAAEPTPVPTETTAPTNTPRPTRTKAPTATPGPEELTATPGEVAEAVTGTPAPTPTRRPTATPRPAAAEEGVPDTGIGTLGASALALGLVLLLVVVRRLRRAV